MDIGTGLALLGSAKLLEKLLGPTAEYLGEGIKVWTECRIENLRLIFARAGEKLGPRLDEEGSVPPQILRIVLHEGSYAEEKIQQEYFAGILAAGRSKEGIDDRAVSYSTTIARLSHYQLVAHYIIYSLICNEFRGSGYYFGPNDRRRMCISVDLAEFIRCMHLSPKESEYQVALLEHIFFGLHRETLIGDGYWYGKLDILTRLFYRRWKDIALWKPSVPGAELFSAAHGLRLKSVGDLLMEETVLPVIEGVTLPTQVRRYKLF